MNPISFTILTLLYLLSIQQATTSTPTHHGYCTRQKSQCFKSWCKQATDSKLCMSIVESNRRECWKTSPEGVALILIKAAKAEMNKTLSFIRRHLENTTDVETKQGLEHCLFGYQTVGNSLDVSICQLSDDDDRSDVANALSQVDDEVTYDCEWYQPDPFPPVLNQMFKRVNRFSQIINTAAEVVQLI